MHPSLPSFAVLALATEQWAVGLLSWCSRQSPRRPEGKCFGGLYGSFRFVLALIQFGLEPLGAKVAESPQKPSEEYSIPL